MDRIVLIAIAVAVIAVVGATLMLNPGGGGKTTKPAEPVAVQEEPAPDVDTTPQTHEPRGNFTNTTYGATVEEITSDCQLYQHVVSGRFYCFSKSGKSGVMVTNEYNEATSEGYFCKGTVYGCTLYETVYIQPP